MKRIYFKGLNEIRSLAEDPLVMYFVFTFVHSVLDIQKEGIFYHIVIYFLVVAITLLISQFSYSYFEKKFVSYKNKKYTVIPSGQKEE